MMLAANELTNASGAATPLGTWMLYAIGAIAFISIIVRNVIGSMADGTKLWGRKPPIDDDLDQLREELKGLAPAEAGRARSSIKLNERRHERRRSRSIREELKGYVDQEQMDRRIVGSEGVARASPRRT
jgi:uncharacterized protein YhaN